VASLRGYVAASKQAQRKRINEVAKRYKYISVRRRNVRKRSCGMAKASPLSKAKSGINLPPSLNTQVSVPKPPINPHHAIKEHLFDLGDIESFA
jgi:hypothetical protein